MTDGSQDERMRGIIALAAQSLTENAEQQTALSDHAMASAREVLRGSVGDAQSGVNAERAADRAAVLAIVRAAVAAGFPRAVARAAAARAYHDPRGRKADPFEAVLKAEDPVAILKNAGLTKGFSRSYGESMRGHDESGEDHADLVVTTCAYNDFFRKHGEADLTFIFCTADWAWMDRINASDRPIAIERPTTLSTGGTECRFHFVRTNADRKPEVDIVRSVPEAQFAR